MPKHHLRAVIIIIRNQNEFASLTASILNILGVAQSLYNHTTTVLQAAKTLISTRALTGRVKRNTSIH